MKPTPDGWPRISASLFYDDAKAAIDWLCKAFGFELRLLVEAGDGAVAHSELVFGDGLIMIEEAGGRRPHQKSPHAAGGCTQGLMVFVDDLDAHCHRARGRRRDFSRADGERLRRRLLVGPQLCRSRQRRHHWWFVQRLKTGDPNWSKVRDKRERHSER